MTFGFDIDGTITRFPTEMAEMMKSLLLNGNRVIVVTGMLDANPCDIPHRTAQLLSFGIEEGVHYHQIHIARGPDFWHVGADKGRILKEENARMFIDDAPQFIIQIRAGAPDVPVLHVVP